MSWGIKITLLYTTFVAGILFMVIRSTFQKWDLVTDDYYGEEIKYQNQINKLNNTTRLAALPNVSVAGKVVSVDFPAELRQSAVSGTIKFYKPSNAAQDFSMPLQLDSEGKQKMELASDVTGRFNVQLSWASGGVDYYKDYYLSVQ